MKKYHQGIFTPTNPQKYLGDVSKITFRSSWELKVMMWCDKNQSVLAWNSEELIIDYYSPVDQRNRRYFVDFVVRMRNNEGVVEDLILEIKPYKETIPPVKGNKKSKTWLKEAYNWEVNKCKWEAATNFAKANNMKFIILNEYDLGLAQKPKKLCK